MSLTFPVGVDKQTLQGEVTPLRLDWYHSLNDPGNEDDRANMIQLSRALPHDLTLVATDVVSPSTMSITAQADITLRYSRFMIPT